jgi:uncharacterized cupredoxin-like copper-binding protein
VQSVYDGRHVQNPPLPPLRRGGGEIHSNSQKTLYLILLIIILTACSAQPHTTTVISAQLSEYSISPSEWRVPAGQTITLKLENPGKKAHTWTLLKDPPTEPFSSDDLANLIVQFELQPEASQTFTFKSPAASGEYSITSSLPGDLEAGMGAKLVVVQPGY